MNTPSNPDFESLQQLLANAFAVQESQINTQSLADIMRVQRLVESGKLSLDGAMRQIVDSARKVANASGAAIALVSGDHLTYRAGSGTSAVCIGWSVAASLTVAAGDSPNREILRVENSQTDTRIEADICRQFGASSLLILPIYLHGVVAGVLDIRFSEPHAFQDGEVRTYRLMAEQIETALCHPAPIEPPENRVEEIAPVPEPIEEVSPASASFVALPDETFVHSPDEEVIPPVDENLVLPPDFRMLPENEHSLYARCGAVMADILELPVFKQFVWLANQLTQPVRHIRWTPRRRTAPLTAADEIPSVPGRSVEHTAARISIPRQWVKIVTWPARWRVSYLAAARELSNALSSSLRGTVLRTTALTQRAKNLTWPTRWRNFPLVAVAELSSTFRRSILQATMLRQRAKSLTWPSRWRNASIVAAQELSTRFRRSALRAAMLKRRAQGLSLPVQWRQSSHWQRSSAAITAELSSFLKRSGIMMAKLARRANNLVALNPRRRLALETVAIVLAFAALVVYRGRVPAGSLESSTVSHSPAIERQPRPAESLPEKSEFAPEPSPAASISESRHTSNALKRVQVGRNEVDYVADDVTMRVFTPKPPAKRSRTPDGRIAQFGDDVTVRYFAPPPTPARTTTR